MKILNISKLKLNDSHNYYGGAIGNIAYNQFAALAKLDDTAVDTTVEGLDAENDLPTSLSVTTIDSYDDVALYVKDRLSKADVVTHFYFHEPEYNPVSKRLAEAETPFVIGMCEVPHPRFKDEVSGLERLPFVRRIGKRLIMPRFKRTLNRADRLVVVDKQAKTYYSEYYPADRIRIIPYGVCLDRFQPTDFPDVPRILMVNRLIERRGIDYMIEALPDVRDAVSNTELHIVGDGPRGEHLKSRAQKLGVGDAVTFHGNVSASELVEQYAKSTLFSHLSYADGWNQPALEAMASGRPVVCTNKPHNSMVVHEETGYKVPWADSGMLASRLIDILSSPERAEEFGTAGRERVESSYSWSYLASQYRKLFLEIQ
jgi:glycosyltransferase involved in cell wall biosynthesis